MKLKNLQIQHQQYYSSSITQDKYNGKVEFFNEQGAALTIVLRDDQMAGIVEICGEALVKAAKEASQSIITSLTPSPQLEHDQTRDSEEKANG